MVFWDRCYVVYWSIGVLCMWKLDMYTYDFSWYNRYWRLWFILFLWIYYFSLYTGERVEEEDEEEMEVVNGTWVHEERTMDSLYTHLVRKLAKYTWGGSGGFRMKGNRLLYNFPLCYTRNCNDLNTLFSKNLHVKLQFKKLYIKCFASITTRTSKVQYSLKSDIDICFILDFRRNMVLEGEMCCISKQHSLFFFVHCFCSFFGGGGWGI